GTRRAASGDHGSAGRGEGASDGRERAREPGAPAARSPSWARDRDRVRGGERAPGPVRPLSLGQRVRGGARAAARRPRIRTGGVSRRARALAFLAAALVCALLAAAVAGRYRSRVASQYGPLRPVVVATGELLAGHPIGPEQASVRLSVRR